MYGYRFDYNNENRYDFYALKVNEEGLISQAVQAPLNPSIYSLFPNPTSGELLLTCSNCNPCDLWWLRLADLSGRTLFQTQINTEQAIDLSSLADGVYLYQLFTSSNRQVGTGMVLKKGG